jgi:hypothetical protein
MNYLLTAIDETWSSLDNLLHLLPEGKSRDLAECLYNCLGDDWEAGLATLRAQPVRGMWTREESSPSNPTPDQTLPVQSRPRSRPGHTRKRPTSANSAYFRAKKN